MFPIGDEYGALLTGRPPTALVSLQVEEVTQITSQPFWGVLRMAWTNAVHAHPHPNSKGLT